MKQESPSRKLTRFRNFNVESVLGLEQFAQGWGYFGDSDFATVDMWYSHSFEGIIFACKDNIDAVVVHDLVFETLHPIFGVIHNRMVGYEFNEMIRAKDVVDLCMHLHFGQYPDLKGTIPGDFFIASDDGLRLLYQNGRFKSLMLDRKFYLLLEDGVYHCGHYLIGTWSWVHDMGKLIAKTLGKSKG